MQRMLPRVPSRVGMSDIPRVALSGEARAAIRIL